MFLSLSLQLPGSVVSSNGAGGISPDFHHSSPQAVFTSFKLPKPGQQAQTPHPDPSSLMASAIFEHNLKSAGSAVMTAPLGGLPAMASQLAAAAAAASKNQITKSDSPTRTSPPPLQIDPRSTTTTPPPSLQQQQQDSAKGKEDSSINVSSGSNNNNNSSSDCGDSPPKNPGLIKARGTYYPLTAFPTSMPQGPVMRREADSPPRTEASSSGKKGNDRRWRQI